MPVVKVKPSKNEKTGSDKGAHPLKTDQTGPIVWEAVHTRRLTKLCRELLSQTPEESRRFFG